VEMRLRPATSNGVMEQWSVGVMEAERNGSNLLTYKRHLSLCRLEAVMIYLSLGGMICINYF